jgi:ATP-binding cassette subfamily F protein 3
MAEREISRLEEHLNALSDDLALATVSQDVEAITRLGREYEESQAELEAAYGAWEQLSARLEAEIVAIEQ